MAKITQKGARIKYWQLPHLLITTKFKHDSDEKVLIMTGNGNTIALQCNIYNCEENRKLKTRLMF